MRSFVFRPDRNWKIGKSFDFKLTVLSTTKKVSRFCYRYKRYETQLEQTKATNRDVESDFVAEVGGMNHIEPGSEWERVSKHCDFSAKVGRLASCTGIRLILLFAGTWPH